MADEECFPPGLQRLTQALASATFPGIEEIPDLTDVEEFGPCFNAAAIRSQGTRLTSSGSWAAVRLKVLSLVATCPTLKVVNLCECCIDDESEMRILGLGLEKSEALEQLNLAGNTAVGSKAGCGFVNRIMKGCKNLHTLNLARVGMSWEGMATISGAMGHDVAVRSLDVSGNPKLGDNGMALLSAVLKGQMNADHSRRASYLEETEADPSSPPGFKGLKSLTVGYMGVGGAGHLAKALATQTSKGSLEVLKIIGGTEEEEEEFRQRCPLQVLLKPLVHPGPVTEYDDMATPAMYNESLKILSLRFVQEDGLANIIAEILRSNNTLLELQLEGSEFLNVEWREIIKALHENTALKSLFLGSCKGLGDLFEDFMDLIRVNSAIEFIKLPNTELERSGENILIMEALDSGNKGNFAEDYILTALENLKLKGVPSRHETWGENITADDVNWSGLTKSDDDTGTSMLDLKMLPKGLFNLILQLTAENPTITVLPQLSSLNVEEFGDFFAFPHFTRESKDQTWWQTRRAILSFICCCRTLTHIDLEGCGIHREEEVQDLCLGLANSQRLEVLNLGGNGGFGSEIGCLHLCRLLVKIPTLRVLHLHAIDMKPDFLVYLKAALGRTENRCLEVLDINFNPCLGDEGAENLAALLDSEVSSGIRHLRMFGTGMGIDGANRVSSALRTNTSLLSLFVGFETDNEKEVGPLSILLSALVPETAALVPDTSGEDSRDNSTQLGCNRSLENLGVCGGREIGLAKVVATILQQSRIRALTLNCSYFSIVEWQVIFKSLHDNVSLEALDMTRCEGLDASVHKEMVTMLQSNAKLADITVAQTELERSGRHMSIQQELLQRSGSSSSSGSVFLTPTTSDDWSRHGPGFDIPPGTPYETNAASNHSKWAAPGTTSPYQASPHMAVPVPVLTGHENPNWVAPSTVSGPPPYSSMAPPGQPSSTPGPPSYFSPPGQPSSTPGPPSYFSSGPSPGPPRHQSSTYAGPPPRHQNSTHLGPPPPYPGTSSPLGHSDTYQTHAGGYMMDPVAVNSHYSSHHVSHQPSQHSSHHSSNHPPHQKPTSNDWSPSGEPVWWAKPENADQGSGPPSDTESESTQGGGESQSGSRRKNWMKGKKDKLKVKSEKVLEVAKVGKNLVKEVAKDRKDRVLGKLAKNMSTKR